MKSTDVIQPLAMSTAIATNGSRNQIPEVSTSSDLGYASISTGFPDNTMVENGNPPRGQDANGLFYLSTDQKVYLQNGGIISFNQDVSDTIGGYPYGAILDYYDSTKNEIVKVRSLIEDNTNNFVNDPTLIDGINWQAISTNSEGGSSLSLFDTIIKDHVLTYEESKGYALQGTYVYKEAVTGSRYGYPTFYNKCIEEYNAGTATETTLGDNTITMYVNSNGHTFYDIADKDAVDEWFSTYGCAWYYGVDTTNERIFLPRTNIKEFVNDNVPAIGTDMSIGLTDGKNFAAMRSGTFSPGGTIYGILAGRKNGYGLPVGSEAEGNNSSNDLNEVVVGLTKDPTKSGIIADITGAIGNKPTYLYIIVGNTKEESAITDVVDVTTTENDTIPLFTPKYFNFNPNNPSWLRAGEQQNNAGLYTTAYNTLVNLLTNNTLNLKVIDTADIVEGTDYSEYWKVNQDNQYFITPSKLNIFTEEARFLVDKKSNTSSGSPSWFNLYSDGYYEEGGFVTDLSAATTRIELLRTVHSGYTIHLTPYNATDPASAIAVVTDSVTSAGFTVDNISTSLGGVYWSISGYTEIASPEMQSYLDNQKLYFKVANAVENLELLNIGAVTESLAIKADISQLDGAFINKYASLFTNATAGTYTVDLSEYLPNDGYNYEVFLTARLNHTAYSVLNAYSDICGTSDHQIPLCDVEGDGEKVCNSCYFPIGTERSLTVTLTVTSTSCSINAYGYRRIGLK